MRACNSLPGRFTRPSIWPTHRTHFLCESDGLPCGCRTCWPVADENPGVHSTLVGEQIICGARRSQSASGRRYLFLLSRPHTANTYGLRELLLFRVPATSGGDRGFRSNHVRTGSPAGPADRQAAHRGAQALANGELATRVAKPDGEERIFGGDEIQGLVHDFNYMAEQLERLVGAQKILVRDVSHELRSPLARLSVALELAREEAPAAMSEHLQRIEREAGRLNLLIGQLLRLSSMESTNASSHTG